ncbi:MAG: PQQ-binding-like beta-propeller repeat protein [Pseudomonadota bacterium]
MKRLFGIVLILFLSSLMAACGGGDGSGSSSSPQSSVKAISAFSLGGISGTINEANKTILVPIASGADVTAQVATFTSSGASVRVGAAVQASGVTANNFTNQVTYTVTAEDGTTANYRVSAHSQSVAYQLNQAHSGQANFAGPVVFPSTPAWSVSLNGAASYPLVAGGKVFVITAGLNGGYGTNLYALDKSTGAIAWGPIAISGSYFWAGHAYDHGKLFVLNYDGLLKSFDAATGQAGWSAKLPGQYGFSAPPTAMNGIVYVGGAGSGGTLYAVDEANGNLLWSKPVLNGDISSPAVSGDGVFVSYPCQVYKFNPQTGASLWHYNGPCEGGGGKTAVYANGLLYVRDWTDVTLGLSTFNAATGAFVGNLTATTSIPAVTAQYAFTISSGTLQGVGLASHNVLWSFAGDGALVPAPIAINQYVIVGSSSGKVYALDAVTGAQAWSANVGASIAGPDEQGVSQPLTGFGAGEGYLIIPAGKVLTAWNIAP